MRLTLFAPLVVTALASCGPPSPPRSGDDLKIDVVLALEKEKCVVRFADPRLKEARLAVAYTTNAVVWQVQRNTCGEKAKEKVDGKALGLKHLKLKSTGAPARWLNRCSRLDLVPASFRTPPAFRCDIPSADVEGVVGLYEYVIDGDAIEPADPDLDVKKNH
jgi:hypothetical protein